jgi:5-methylthioadenosine/S-adenosylhomocysteine deaminase
MKNIILSAETVMPINSDTVSNSAVVISDGVIVDFKKTSILTRKYKNFKHINLGRGILLPGFINGHIHLELGWMQPHIGNFSNFTEWLSQIISAKATQNLTKKIIQDSVTEGISALTECGVTTIGEVSSFGGADKSVIKNSGLRAVIYEELFDKDIELIAEKKYVNNGLIETRPFPHAPYSCSPELLKKVYKNSKKSGIPVGIHLAESPEETDFIKQKSNNFENKIFPLIGKNRFKRPMAKSPFQYLLNFNKNLENKTTIIHAVQLTKDEIRDAGKSNIGIVLCPRSNLFLKVGVPPLKNLIKLDRIGLGTDGLSSNYNLDFFEEMRTLHLLLSSFMGEEASFKTIYTATLGGARALFLEEKTGSIEKGKEADLIFISYKKKPVDPYLHILSSGKNNMYMNMVRGRIVWSKNDKYDYLNG